MKAQGIILKKDKSAQSKVEEKAFPGKSLDARTFKEKFKAANEAGKKIKGFKKRSVT